VLLLLLLLLLPCVQVYMRLNNVQGCSQVLKNFKQNYSGEVLQVRQLLLVTLVNPAACAMFQPNSLGRTAMKDATHLPNLQTPCRILQRMPAAYRLCVTRTHPAELHVFFATSCRLNTVCAHYHVGRTKLNSDNIEG
jgi:hypothetical protein